jgi:hypothetical protein
MKKIDATRKYGRRNRYGARRVRIFQPVFAG